MNEGFFPWVGRKISAVLIKIFGASWRTSLWGILSILPQIAKPVQDYLETQKISANTLNIVTMIFAVLFVLTAKDKQVTGGTIPNGK